MESLKQRDCKEALEWCNTHKTKLQKTNVELLIFDNYNIELTGVQTSSAGIY